MTIYAIANGKGGVGKSVTAAELVAALQRAGRIALGVDLDQQGNLTKRLGVNEATGGILYDAADVIRGDAGLTEAAIEAPAVAGAHLVVGSHKIATVTPQEVPDMVTGLQTLIRTTSPLPWDDVVLDCPPSLVGTTLTALAAADVVIGVSSCEESSVEQVDRLNEMISGVIARRIRPEAVINWIVPTMYTNTREAKRGLEDLQIKWGSSVTTPIRRATVVSEAYRHHQPVSRYRPGADVSTDYIEALGPIIRQHSTSRSN